MTKNHWRETTSQTSFELSIPPSLKAFKFIEYTMCTAYNQVEVDRYLNVPNSEIWIFTLWQLIMTTVGCFYKMQLSVFPSRHWCAIISQNFQCFRTAWENATIQTFEAFATDSVTARQTMIFTYIYQVSQTTRKKNNYTHRHTHTHTHQKTGLEKVNNT